MQLLGGTSNFATPRTPFSARDGGTRLQTSARHILKPQVGVTAMRSALGDIKPAWEGANFSARSSASTATAFTNPADLQRASQPYHVGRARIRDQLRLALETPDEAVQLRRLEQTLNSPVGRYDGDMQLEMMKASEQATDIAQRLHATKTDLPAWKQDPFADPKRSRSGKKAKPTPAPENEKNSVQKEVAEEVAEEIPGDFDSEEADAAALRIQSVYRGRKDREVVAARRNQIEANGPTEEADERAAAEEQLQMGELGDDADAAALRIQSVYRGRKDREAVAALRDQIEKEEEAAEIAAYEAEMDAAALKIQAVYRGNAARKGMNGEP